MADILSQSEIDALLSALDGGDVSVEDMQEDAFEAKIKDYDFKSPKKLAKDQLKTLSIINENYSRLLNTYLSGYLRVVTSLEVSSVEELSYYEFSNSITNPAMIGIVNFEPLPGQIIFECSNRLAFTMVDRILGGDGNSQGETRAFTEIETLILAKLINNCVEYMVESWDNVVELSPSLDKIESNSQFVQIVSPNDTVALITMTARVGEVEGFINICIPHIVLEPILPKLSTNFLFSNIKKEFDEKGKKQLENRVKRTKVTAVAEVGSSYISVSDFIFMQVGDVITLDRKIDEELELKIDDKIKFLGQPGTFDKNMAFKVTKVVEESGEKNE